jgi:hypothetical protein
MSSRRLAPDMRLSPGVSILSPRPVRQRFRVAASPERPEHDRALPGVEPGQLWLLELLPDRPLSTIERHLLRSANVIVYDRGLAAAVAGVLPLGGYAEPADLSDGAALDRCVRFARDGWGVIRLLDGSAVQTVRGSRLRAVSARLRAGGAEIHLAGLDGMAGGLAPVIVRFGAGGPAPPPVAVAANGLAG